MSKKDGRSVSLRNGDFKAKDRKGKNAAEASVPFHKLFIIADSVDIVLPPVFFFSINFCAFQNIASTQWVSLKFVYLSVGAAVVSFLQVSCWMNTGERQPVRIRSLYLSNILRQDIAFFDKDTNTAEVIGRMSGDTILIQDAMGKKVGKALQLVSTSFGSFVVAFIKGWRLDLVMMTSIPLIVFADATMALVMTKLSALGQAAYADAGILVEQTVGSIRMVASFTGEKEGVNKYNNSLVTAYLATVNKYKMFETIERKPEIDVYNKGEMVMKDLNGEIELKDVHFSYPARPDVTIFSVFSLHVPSGTTVALVGESGVGSPQ